MKIFILAKHENEWGAGRYYINAFKKLGHVVEAFDYVEHPTTSIGKLPILSLPSVYPRIQRLGIRKEEKKIKAAIERFKPDFVLGLKAESVLTETIDWIRNDLGTFTALWSPDDPQLFNAISRHIAPHYDYVFSSSVDSIKDYRRIGVNKVEYIAYACDPSVHKVVGVNQKEAKYLGSDLCFIGAAHPERIVDFHKLVDKNMKIWGPRWTLHNTMFKLIIRFMTDREKYSKYSFWKMARIVMNTNIWSKHMGRGIYGPDLAKAFNSSKIILNGHHLLQRDFGMQANLKIFEATGCKSFLLTDRPKGLEKLFRIGKELVCYNNPDDIVEKVDYFLNNEEERKKIAEAGQKRAYADHTFVHRAEQILKVVKGK